MNINISVIIPTYNVEAYIRKALESVINQTLKELEIIIIDNKSVDNTLDIVKNYQSIDNRIKIIENSSNLKQGQARNIGLANAQGEYVFFLDGDDYLELTALEKFYKKACENSCDIVISCWSKFDDKTGKIIGSDYSELKNIPDNLKDKIFSYEDIRESVFRQTTVCWDKLYKRSFLINNGIKFPIDLFYEDNVFVFECLVKAQKISVIRDKLIYYRINRKNALTLKTDKTLFDYLKVFDLIEEKLKEINVFSELKIAFYNHKLITFYWYFMRIKFVYKKEFFNLIKQNYKKLEFQDDEKSLLSNRARFLFDRFLNMPFNLYYPFFFYFDKIFRIERGEKNLFIFLSKYPKEYKNF